jgi:UDP-N-acetylmuramyl pentapeptide phosphotransferase/UDP-N-acetylglucosamine-1-phosphate transferase
VLSAILIALLRPLLFHYALAKPNARSSHLEPTPQGGGIAVIGAMTIVVVSVAILVPSALSDPDNLAVVFACMIALATLGATDDLRPLEALPRLLVQAFAVLVLIFMLPESMTVIPALPWWIERALLAVTLLWFVNLTNFMDGIDWMTVSEVVPVTAALAIFGAMGALPKDAALTSIALCGAMIGFAPFNRPVARLFLGDVGSLPIGLCLGWLLITLAGNGHLAAALLLPLYYVADATITLLRRMVHGEDLMRAHRSHFYQRAMDSGFRVYKIVEWVFVLNIILVALALATLLTASPLIHAGAVVMGCILVGALLYRFAFSKA